MSDNHAKPENMLIAMDDVVEAHLNNGLIDGEEASMKAADKKRFAQYVE